MTEKTSQPAAMMIFVALLTVMMPSAEAQTPSKPKPLPPVPASPTPQIKAPAMTSYVADTQQPVTKSGAVPAGAISWQCQGNRCQAGGPAATPTANACRALASQVGAMQSFAIGNQQLDASGLMQCNAGLTAGAAKSPAPTTPVPTVLDQMQKNMPGPKPGMVPDVSTKPEVWSQGKTGSAAVPAPKSMPGKPVGGFVPTDQSGQTTLPAKSPSDPAKKSSGGFVPQQQSAAAPKPGTSDKKTKPSPGGPVTFTTAALTATGTGALAARLPFTAKSFSTATITATGTGALPERLPFTPRSFSTTPLTATGTGSL